jgi:two-component system sensor histidine kinase KdpD
LDSESITLLETLAEQTSAALERAVLARDIIAARSATETERVRNTLLASISHDFRTPLASILGSATSLIDYGNNLEPKARKELLGQIKEEAEGLDDMVRNLLAITRIDAGVLELRNDWIDVREIVERVVSNTRRRHPSASIDVPLPPDLPLLRADATLLQQALTNIVENSLLHTPEGAKVTIGAQVNPVQVMLVVTDDGPGIAPDLLPRVLEKFSRAGTPEQAKGVGLGLAIAKGIVEAHGGSISVQSPVEGERGTRILLTLPRQAPP